MQQVQQVRQVQVKLVLLALLVQQVPKETSDRLVQQVQQELQVTLVEQHLTTPSLQQQLKQTQELESFALIRQTYKLQHLCLSTTKLMAQLIFSHSFVLSTIRQAQSRVTCESATRPTQLTLRFSQSQVQSLRKVDTSQFQFLM